MPWPPRDRNKKNVIGRSSQMWIGLPHYDSPQTSASLSALFIVQTCFTNHRTTVFSLLHPCSQIVGYRIVRLSEWKSYGWGAERGPDEIPPKKAPVRPPGTIANFTLQSLESHMLFGRPVGGADGQSGTLGAVGSTHCIAVDNQSVD